MARGQDDVIKSLREQLERYDKSNAKLRQEIQQRDFVEQRTAPDPRVATLSQILDPMVPIDPRVVDRRIAPAMKGDLYSKVVSEGPGLVYGVAPEECQSMEPSMTLMPQKEPFVECHPFYRREEDIWERRLEMRSLDEVLRGPMWSQMPPTILRNEDYEHYREGRYVKDDCFIA